jgi:rhamnogalacturonyl hydrolase YesR
MQQIKNGILYHGWDENMPWAKSRNRYFTNFGQDAMIWYMMAFS